MTKRKRILLIVIGILVVLAIIISLFANSIAKNKIEALLKNNIPNHIEYSYKSFSVNVLGGSISYKDLNLLIKVKDTSLVQANIKMESFTVGGLSYWDYLFNDEIHIGKLKFDALQLTYYKDHKNQPKDSTNKGKAFKLPRPIIIDNINFKNSTVSIFEDSKDSTLLSSKNINLDIKGILLNEKTLSSNISIEYENISIKTGTIFYKAGDYENLNIHQIEINNNTISLHQVKLETKYSKTELSKIITKERDHYDVKIENLKINNFDFGFENDSLFIKSNLISINNLDAVFYKDKLVADDYKIKKIYSKSIRELPIKLTIDSVTIINGNVAYSEKAHAENPAGTLNLSNLNGGITNLSNTYKSPEKTTINVEGIFMKNSPMKAAWSFDVNQTNEAFTFRGHLGKLEASDMNAFITPLINVELEGEILETHFEITGDFNQSIIHLSQNYDNIKLDLLNKKRKKMKTLSEIANVFINDDSQKGDDIFHNVTANVSRDKTKSFFNYLARNLKASLLIMFTKKNKTEKQKTNKRKDRKKD